MSDAGLQAKRLATLRARAALAGVTLIDSNDETGHPEWIATRWALTKSFSSLDELAAWLDRVTGVKEAHVEPT